MGLFWKRKSGDQFVSLKLNEPLPKTTAEPPAATAPDDDPDRDPNRNVPDFTIVNLPTTLRVPRYKSAFRVTHRFGRPLGAGHLTSSQSTFDAAPRPSTSRGSCEER